MQEGPRASLFLSLRNLHYNALIMHVHASRWWIWKHFTRHLVKLQSVIQVLFDGLRCQTAVPMWFPCCT